MKMASYHHSYQLEYDSTVWDPAPALLLGHDQQHHQKRPSYVLHQVAARTLRRPESFVLDLASLRADGGQAGFELYEDTQRCRKPIDDLGDARAQRVLA